MRSQILLIPLALLFGTLLVAPFAEANEAAQKMQKVRRAPAKELGPVAAPEPAAAPAAVKRRIEPNSFPSNPMSRQPAGSSQKLQRVEADRLRRGLAPADQIPGLLANLKDQLLVLGRREAPGEQGARARRSAAGQARNTLQQLIAHTRQLTQGFRQAERVIGPIGGSRDASLLEALFEGIYEDLESQERLGNMEIQDLMSRYNQAEQLAGSVFKKKDDADLSIVNKI